MQQPLPLGGFKWVPVENFNLSMLGKEKGYILEIDSECDDEFHDKLNDYPLAPEKMSVTCEMLSPLQQRMTKSCGNVEKLIPNLNRKTKYVIHHRVLQKYIELGMRVTKIHRVIEFIETPWLKPFIKLTTRMRKEATQAGDDAGASMFKLMSNAVFGKACENLEKRANVELVTSSKTLKKRLAKPNFKRSKIFREDLVGVELTHTKIVLKRPMHVGFAILEISKTLMYEFHYDKWMPKFPEAKLLFTDTDSLCYMVNRNPYELMGAMSDEFDFSEYPKTHPLYDKTNMKVLGKMKDECKGQQLVNFIGLRPKLYSMQKLEFNKNTETLELTNDIKAKGLTKAVRTKQLKFEDFEKCVKDQQVKIITQRTIGSSFHKLYSYETNKIGLSAADDKRWICEDGVSTLAHGHYKLRNIIASKATSTDSKWL